MTLEKDRIKFSAIGHIITNTFLRNLPKDFEVKKLH